MATESMESRSLAVPRSRSTGALPLGRDRAANVVLWAVLAACSLLVGGYFVVRVYRHVSADAALAMVELLGRTAILASAGLSLEAWLVRAGDPGQALDQARRIVLQVVWTGAMLLCICLLVDVATFAFAGYHLLTGAGILLSGGARGLAQSIEAVGVSPWAVAGGVLATAAAVCLSVYLSKLASRASGRAGLVIERRTAFQALFAATAAIAVLEAVSHNVRNAWLWEREIRSVPLAFSIARPEAELASFRVSPRRPPSARERAAAVAVAPWEEKPDVIVFMVESLRNDVVTAENMPRLSAFAADAWTFKHPITTGNVTQYSWYGLFCAELPIYFEAARASPDEHGSVPLAILRRVGYRIHLFASPDTGYQGIREVVFGDGGLLLDTHFHPDLPEVAQRDQAVVAEFARAMAASPRGGGVYVVALDSTHFDYSWGAGFQPPYGPIAPSGSVGGREVDAWARAALMNRYRNAVAWVDVLLGQALDAIQASGRMGSSYVVVTGDHGEAFWEHGAGTHGTDLSREQVEVGFAMKVPGMAPRHFDGVFSLLDVMPTVLHGLGIPQADAFQGVPVQERLPGGREAMATLAPRDALTFRGVNERARQFALTTREERIVFELDRLDPLEAKRLSIKVLTDLADRSLVGGDARDAGGAYDRLIRDIPRVAGELPFLAP
jgi:hypothetical protein